MLISEGLPLEWLGALWAAGADSASGDDPPGAGVRLLPCQISPAVAGGAGWTGDTVVHGFANSWRPRVLVAGVAALRPSRCTA